MSVGRIKDKVKSLVASSGDRKSPLLPKSYFLECAHREHRRAARSSSQYSILVLSLNQATYSAPVELHNLSKVLPFLLRETDLIGWYDENAIAILLVDTGEKGTSECVRRILDNTAGIPLSCVVRTYPDLATTLPQKRVRVLTDSAHSTTLVMSPPSRAAIALKRGIDLVGSLTAIVLFSPVMLLAALAIKASSPGPIIFKQIRVGQAGVPFVFLKFRSMQADAAADSHREYVLSLIKANSSDDNQRDVITPFRKMKADVRITPVGRFLRKSSIDELPQLFNVLRGEMSLVGPRPPIPYEVEAYSAWHLRRLLEVKPGITGLWQVEGRSAVSFDDMVRLDLQYARHWSILLDLKILLKTVKVVLQGRGAA